MRLTVAVAIEAGVDEAESCCACVGGESGFRRFPKPVEDVEDFM